MDSVAPGTSEITLIIIALIPAISSIVLALITRQGHKKTSAKVDENTAKTEAVLHQVKNDHNTNLREDLDRMQSEIHKQLHSIENAQAYLGKTVGHALREIKDTKRRQQAHDTAALLIVEELKKRDEELAREIESHNEKDHE